MYAQPPAGPTDESEEAILQQTLALSEGRTADVEMTEDRDGDGNLTEAEMIARAIEMSMRPEPESEEKK
jgi:26S proteasome regulatory subunit N10